MTSLPQTESLPQTDAWTYDDFRSARLDPARWTVMSVTGADGERHRYRDRNARVRTGDGRLELTVNPFTRFHDTDPRQNNAKQMYRSVRRFAVPAAGRLTFEVAMGVRTYGQVPYDLLDAYGTVNVFDMETGVVLNAAATNDTVYAVIERLALPGVTQPHERYIHRVVLEVPTEAILGEYLQEGAAAPVRHRLPGRHLGGGVPRRRPARLRDTASGAGGGLQRRYGPVLGP